MDTALSYPSSKRGFGFSRLSCYSRKENTNLKTIDDDLSGLAYLGQKAQGLQPNALCQSDLYIFRKERLNWVKSSCRILFALF